MTQTEHLKLIRARCVELLEIAEKRTALPWEIYYSRYEIYGTGDDGEKALLVGEFNTEEDFRFIASCAGAAEAGWSATIAAIDGIWRDAAEDSPEADAILAAWTIELLNP